MTARHQNHSSTSILGLLVVLLTSLAAVACSEVEPDLTLNQRVDLFEADLVADGIDSGVAACVTRLAAHDLRSGPVDPVTLDELVLNCERAERILNDVDSTEPEQDLAFSDGPFAVGDDPELDRLWQQCADGNGAACNQLFESSPVGSEYEEFGVTCGQRNEILNCAELDDPDRADG